MSHNVVSVLFTLHGFACKYFLYSLFETKKRVKAFANKFAKLTINKQAESFFFTFFFTKVNRFDKPINRSWFDTQFNLILYKVSIIYTNHISRHTFKASIITDLLKSRAVDIVKDIIGHKKIGIFLRYKREDLDPIQMKKVLQKLDIDSNSTNQL